MKWECRAFYNKHTHAHIHTYTCTHTTKTHTHAHIQQTHTHTDDGDKNSDEETKADGLEIVFDLLWVNWKLWHSKPLINSLFLHILISPLQPHLPHVVQLSFLTYIDSFSLCKYPYSPHFLGGLNCKEFSKCLLLLLCKRLLVMEWAGWKQAVTNEPKPEISDLISPQPASCKRDHWCFSLLSSRCLLCLRVTSK